MKIVRSGSKIKSIRMSRKEWERIGKIAQWTADGEKEKQNVVSAQEPPEDHIPSKVIGVFNFGPKVWVDKHEDGYFVVRRDGVPIKWTKNWAEAREVAENTP